MFNKLPPLKDISKKYSYKEGKLFFINDSRPNKKAGDRAGCTHKNFGYRSVIVNGKNYQEHRIIWKLLKGRDPIEELDHINGIRNDNRIENLREVNKATNLKNQKIYKNNKSGVHGIYWNKQKKKWCVQITTNGNQEYYGCYKDLNEAIKIRKKLSKEKGFHKNHGKRI